MNENENCGTCRFYKQFANERGCTCEESPAFARITVADDYCEEWEKEE